MRRSLPWFGPGALVAGVTMLLAVWPPLRGTMLLVPLSGGTARAVNAALAGGGTLLARGPLPGSVIVAGDRARLLAASPRGTLLPLAAPSRACGSLPVERGDGVRSTEATGRSG